MTHRPAKPGHRNFARKMRHESTDAEHRLWQELRNRRLNGMKFRRQEPLAGYIVDFVCFENKLVIEVDGGQHAESERDIVRDKSLEGLGFLVLRFWNDDIFNHIDSVCDRVVRIAAGLGKPKACRI